MSVDYVTLILILCIIIIPLFDACLLKPGVLMPVTSLNPFDVHLHVVRGEIYAQGGRWYLE